MRIVIVTDAWSPQVNGVVQTLQHTARWLEAFGHTVELITPEGMRSMPCPSYPSIRLAMGARKVVAERLRAAAPDAIHIATEGPLGLAARRWCLRHQRAFTTSYHTQFPEYLRARLPIPLALTYRWLRWFHQPANRTLVPSNSQLQRLKAWGFAHLEVWGRGVDRQIFEPSRTADVDLPRPIFVNLGRVAIEKNIEAFLKLDLPGSKVVIGDGPDLDRLRKAYPDTHFWGAKFGRDLAMHLSACDVFVFPSRTDTFGLVILEALSCGLPVAAFPVTGPKDLLEPYRTGVMHADLQTAALEALGLDRRDCLRFAQTQTWEAATRVFERSLCQSLHTGTPGMPVHYRPHGTQR